MVLDKKNAGGDPMDFQRNGGAAIQKMISEAIKNNKRQITVTGDWEIEQTILLPSYFILILENCHLVMADNTFCNMFTNEHCRTLESRTAADADHDIHIEGRGRVILDGGPYNGLSERNHSKEGRPHISVNNILLFVNVAGFSVSGIHVRNQRWWALNFIYCRYGQVRNIDFLSDYTYVQPDGTRVQGLTRHEYAAVYIKNSDGIDLRTGCHDIIIENITGFIEDDSVALTGLNGQLEQMFNVTDLPSDIHNVIVRNINTASYCSNVRLLNQGGVKLYNILIDGVMDASRNSPYMDRGGCGVRVGDNHLYGERHSLPEETAQITIRNVYSRATRAVSLAGSITGLVLDNIQSFDGCDVKIDNQASLF